MRNLIRNEFYNLLKEKASWIFASIYMVIQIIVLLFCAFLNTEVSDSQTDLIVVNVKTMFPIYFSLSIGGIIILCIMVLTLLERDFSGGTIRNKVIAGHSRSKIYFSKLIVFLSASLTLFFIGLFFGIISFGIISGFGSDWSIGYILKYGGIGLLHIIFALSLSFFLGIIVKKTGASISIIVGLTVLFTYANLLIPMFSALGVIDQDGPLVWFLNFIPFFQNSISLHIAGIVLAMDDIGASDIILYVISNIAYIGALIVGGLFLFRKKDLN
jgi:ABC-type transport system involved in multi-copper enzyme maturation permease subunit